jgi:integrase
MGNPRLSSVDQLVIQGVRTKLAEKYAPATLAVSMSYLFAIMRAAHVSGRIPRDATIGLRSGGRRGERDRVGPDDVPTRSEVATIWQAAPARYRAAIALGATGLRVGEVLGLTVDRLDLERRLVTIDRQLQRVGNDNVLTTTKTGKPRTIRVPTAVALELRRHVRDHQGAGLLFRGLRDAPELRRDQFYSSAWRPSLVAAGLASDRFVFHSLRHFAASSMLAEGVNPMAVAGHLGDTLETLQRTYSHWLRDDRDVPADVLDRILFVPSLCPAEESEAF